MLGASSDVYYWILEVPHYHGLHIGCQFLSWVCFSTMHWAHGIEDTNTLSSMYILIYLLPPIGDIGIQGDTRGLLIY